MDNTKGTTLNTYLYFFDDFVDDQQRIKNQRRIVEEKIRNPKINHILHSNSWT